MNYSHFSRLSLLLSALCFSLSSCSDPQVVAPSSSSKTITLSEGTNLAAAYHAGTNKLVMALQGRLYLQPASGDKPIALTNWQDDAWEPDINPMGTMLIYEGYRDGNWDLWQRPLRPEAEIQQLTSGLYDEREPQYSPDGSQVIFSSDRGGSYDIWVLNLVDNAVRQLTETSAETHSPTWGPTGAAFAYISDGRPFSNVYIQDIASGTTRKLYETKGKLSGLSWSPDGQHIALRSLDRAANGNALSALRLIDVSTGEDRIVSPKDSDVFPFRAQWINANSFVYTADGLVQQWQNGVTTNLPFAIDITLDKPVYTHKVYDFDTTTDKPVLGISYPVLSPDGEYLAYSALGDLWLWHIPSKTLSQLTDDPGADQSPSWSPDGKSLTYVSDQNGKYQVWLYKLASNTTQAIEIDRDIVSFPAFSPDAKKIVFFTDVPGEPLLHVSGQLTVFNLDDSSLEYILKPMPPEPIMWSANGNYVLTTQLVRYTQRFREGLYDLAIANIKTGQQHTIRPTEHQSIKHASYSAGASAVAYSQNGILYTLALSSDMQAAGAPTIVYNELADTPSWAANGRYISFQAGNVVKRIDIVTGDVIDITPKMSWTREQPRGTWILRAGKLYDGISETYKTNVDVLITNNRIVAINPIDLSTQLPVLDASDKAVIPGMFESHAHIGDHNLSEQQGRVWLAYGITSVRDPGSNPYLANERKEAWDSGRRSGPRTFITGHNIDGNRVFYAVTESIASDEHLERALLRSKLLNVDFIKTYVRLPNYQQKRVAEFAHSIGVPTTSHELMPAAAMGVDGIEHFTGTSRRGYTTKISELGRSYQDVEEILVASNMTVIPTMVVPGVVLTFNEQDDLYNTPSFNAFYGQAAKQNYQDFMGFFGPGAEGYVDNYGELLTKLIDRNALVGTGTDSPFTPFGTGMHAELRLYQREGLKPWQILHAATYQSARIAGAEHDLGSIEAGKLADMVIIDGDPLNDVSALSNITTTIKNGRVYPVEELRKGEQR